MAAGLPGRLMISEAPRVPAICRDRIAVFTVRIDTARMCSPKPGSNRSHTAIVASGVITHKAWVKYLRQNYRKLSINRILTTLDVAMAIEARTGKPVDSTRYVAEGSNFAVDMTVDNLSVASPPILIVADGVAAANTIVGLDTRYGIRRVINAQAQYSAIEQYLMRRATAFRIDYGEYSHRLYDEAFSVMTLTT